jgi:hypothetical protein
LALVESGLITVVGDAASLTILKELSPMNYNICGSHNISNLLKRLLEINLGSTAAADEWFRIKHFIDTASSVNSSALPTNTSIKSINQYLNDQEPTSEEKELLAKERLEITIYAIEKKPNIMNDEIKKKAEKIKNFPKIKKVTGTTRFRGYTEGIRHIHIAQRILQEIQSETSPGYHLSPDIPLNFDMVNACNQIGSEIEAAINKFESDSHSQAGNILGIYEDLLIFGAQDLTSRDNFINVLKRSLISTIMEHLFQIHVDKNGVKTPSNRVPKRMTELEKVAKYLCLKTTFCDMYEVKKELRKLTTDKQAIAVIEVIETQTNSWSADAKTHIKLFDRNLGTIVDQIENLEVDEEPGPAFECDSRFKSRKGNTPKTAIDTELSNYENMNEQDLIKCKLKVL